MKHTVTNPGTDTDTINWGITNVGAKNSWNSGYTGEGVTIAVIDTGIDTDHPDFAATTTTGAGAIVGGISEVGYTNSYEDDNGHGTHCAGIIAARQNGTGIVGIAPQASIYAVKALDRRGSGSLLDVVKGIDWAMGDGSRLPVDIISMSLGSSTYSEALENACNNANNAGILVVAAAGNTGTATIGDTDTINYPARYDSVIAVGAVDSKDVRASFSSTGKELDVVAPGVNIYSDFLKGTYTYMSGTSMATPYVAGNLALLKQANPTYSSTELRNLLQNTAKDLGPTDLDSLYGHGLIQAPVAPAQ